MMNRTVLLGSLLHPGCATAADQPPPTVPPPPPCPISRSSEWRAWVNAMPGPGSRPTLIVTGKVTVPGPDWQPRWGPSQVLESYPVQVRLELDADLPPGGISRDPVVKEVRGSWPSEAQVGSVTVLCRGTVLARIAPVETAL
jgi:hypothetical protein